MLVQNFGRQVLMPFVRTSLCPKKCVLKVVSESVKRDLLARQLTPRERPVTLIPSWVHTKSNIVSMPREIESNLQAWNPNASGSRTWPKEEIEQSIDLRVDGIAQRRNLHGRAVHAKNRRTSPKTCDYKRKFKDDSPEDNILSEKAVKKIHEAGNCESFEIQLRTNKVPCQRCYSYIEAGFQVCPCGGQLNMSEEMLSSTKQNFKQLIADAFFLPVMLYA